MLQRAHPYLPTPTGARAPLPERACSSRPCGTMRMFTWSCAVRLVRTSCSSEHGWAQPDRVAGPLLARPGSATLGSLASSGLGRGQGLDPLILQELQPDSSLLAIMPASGTGTELQRKLTPPVAYPGVTWQGGKPQGLAPSPLV
eukprot:gene18562-biopygen12965